MKQVLKEELTFTNTKHQWDLSFLMPKITTGFVTLEWRIDP